MSRGSGSGTPWYAPGATGFLLLTAALGTACGGKRVSRIDPAAVTDLSGRWNDTDSRLVANRLIEESLSHPWHARFAETHGGEAPRVIVGTFRNRSMEHIPVSTFVRDLERAFVNSGLVTLVASSEEREELRAEREDQQEQARADTRAELGRELGANYMLHGEIQSIEDEEGREKIVFYQIDATLIDLESNVVTWAGQHKIKKYIERSRFGSD
ncbi:MAG: penicillin-binding protein activator LpoB [Gemmatimonadota bacterium]